MFNIEHPDDYLSRITQERERQERRARLLRALRGSTPPFSEATERELRTLMQEQLQTQTEHSR
jgi:hypothetical protein